MKLIRLFPAYLLLACLSLVACKKDEDPTPAAPATLYERLGKVEGITRIVDKFMANVGAECAQPNSVLLRSHMAFLADVGAGNDFRRLVFRNNLIDQLGSEAVSGGPLAYKGKSMVDAHRGMHITDAEFDAVSAQLGATLDFYNVPAADKTALSSVLGGMRGQIVNQ